MTPIVKSNIIHTEAYLRVMDQLSDYLKNNPGIHQLRIVMDNEEARLCDHEAITSVPSSTWGAI